MTDVLAQQFSKKNSFFSNAYRYRKIAAQICGDFNQIVLKLKKK